MVRLQFACLVMLIFIAVIYWSIRRVKSYSHRLFSVSLILSIIYTINDMISVYTVNHLETVPPVVNRFVHNLFMGSLMIEIFIFFSYTITLIYDREEELKKKRKKWTVPIVIALVAMMFLPLDYIETEQGNYSMGPAVIGTYGVVAVYSVMIGKELLLHWKEINKYKRTCVLFAYGTQIVLSVYQAIVPTALTSSLGIALINLSVFLTVENPDVHMIEMLRMEKERADEANAAKSRFLSNISHEIRTPMNAIVGLTEVLLRKEWPSEEKGYLLNIHNSGNALLNLINDLLDFSKIEAGKFEIVDDTYDMEQLLRDVHILGKVRIGNKKLELKMNIDPQLPKQLWGDGLRIRQVIINILNNAIKYTEQGVVTLTVKIVETEEERVKIYISVRDTGQGIRQEELSKLFDAFTQVDIKKNQGKESTGLGLTISSQLVELMGGRLEVASEYGRGSEFFFTVWQGICTTEKMGDFHAASNQVEDISKNVYKCEYVAPNAHVLVVEDNEINQIVLQAILEPLKIQLDFAENGKEALEMIKNKKYQVILMDHYMPVMDGVETTIEIRNMEDQYYREIPIIALTADAVEGTKEQFYKIGMNDFLTKPVEMKKICKTLQEWIPSEYIVKK
ncbi:MAG: response regulator [Lachnospiraceae bacterium]|nr:response regulator [Lachnospiraceae bacterium]